VIKTMIDESRDAMYEALWHDLRRNRVDADLMNVDYNIREATTRSITCKSGSSPCTSRRHS
jgi:hypothetical protein